jgi:DNA primase
VALVSFLERYPDISRVILHLDNDPAGLTAARKIKMQLQQSHPHIRVSVNPPHQGAKDYNDFLLCAIRSEREREEHRSRDVGFSL